MMHRIRATLDQLRDAVQRHGGGLRGALTIASRSWRIVRTLGWVALIRRIAIPRQDGLPSIESPDSVVFPPALPLADVHLTIGIMVHAFYMDLLGEVAECLVNMPVPYRLMVSVRSSEDSDTVALRFAGLRNMRSLHVRVVPNRGRDIAPFLLDFREEILDLDLVCHLHTKKSLYTDREQQSWRHYLFRSLMGSQERIAWILGTFQAAPTLGMIYPETFHTLPWWAHTWLSNTENARALGARLGLSVDPLAYFDYPAGSMFWSRTQAIRPLLTLGLSRTEFPEETGQTDGTLQHAIERLFGQVVRQQGFSLGILASNGVNALRSEGERNWMAYFGTPIQQQIEFAAANARIVSFDLFDTLVTRPFLHASGARDYLAHCIDHTFDISNFAALRAQAEATARAITQRDVDITEIYAVLGKLPGMRGHDAKAIREFELETEARLLTPRHALLDSATALASAGKRVIAVSDMYLNDDDLRHVLPPPVVRVLKAIRVSCVTGWRKDSGQAWHQLPALEDVPPDHWLHIGDNEHADVQLPLAAGYIGPVHVMRPASLFEVVPALRPLRPSSHLRSRWQDQLWLGLLANHFSDLADRTPKAFGRSLTIDSPDAFGYTVIGPVLLDTVTWLGRLALGPQPRQLLFLSREGYLLLRAFQRVQAVDPLMAAVAANYLLASRRATNTPSLHAVEDLLVIFQAPYTGPLDELLRARLGDQVATTVIDQLGEAAGHAEVYLPEMAATLVDRLRPVATEILHIAQVEREAYLAYWHSIRTAGPEPIVADIGYAATIQSRLAIMTGTPLHGAYLAVRAGAAPLRGGSITARYHDGRTSKTLAAVMQHHLLLESVLTSPDGQFSHFEVSSTGLKPRYGIRSTTDAWPVIADVHAGALRFVDDVCAVTGAETSRVAFDPVHVQQPLHCLGTGQWRLGGWAHALHVEDRYTGRGQVPVATTKPW